ncbi:MAG: hypothetical protein BWY66_02244 [bacterium ADurb.Bin374]|nr:MAG: hypothetical protein BWY66_02244 [bacterium ADurb.Bin374]
MAVRSHHRDLYSVDRVLPEARRRRRRFPHHDVADPAADGHAHRFPPAGAVYQASRPADRAFREGSRPHALDAGVPRHGVDVPRAADARASVVLRRVPVQPGAGVPQVPGPGKPRDHYLLRHARVSAADGAVPPGRARPDRAGGERLRAPSRPSAARHLACRVRVQPRRRQGARRPRHPVLLHRRARRSPCASQAPLWRVRAVVHTLGRGRLRPRSREQQAGLVRGRGIPRRFRLS